MLQRHGEAAVEDSCHQKVGRLGLAQSTTSAHLACLRDCGLVSSRTVGRASVYSLAVGDELMGLLSAAERLLAATGDAVTLCPNNHDNQTADAAQAATVTVPADV